MQKPKNVTKCIIDADIIAYRSAAGTEYVVDPDFVFPTDYQIPKCDIPMVKGTEADTIKQVDKLINYVIGETVVFPSADNLECYLTGKGNFRYEVAKTAPYKGNRKDVVKPTNLPAARQHLIDKWGAVVSQGEEADDLIGIASVQGHPETTVVCTIDKDMMQLPCWFFNFVKNEWKLNSVDEGNKFFYTQILTGDAADNIKGIHRVGPVKAGKILYGLTTEQELYKACLEAYITSSEALMVNPEDRPKWCVERVLENARLLWLRRYEGELWTPPKQ